MLFRDFVEQIKDAAEVIAGNIRGGRDLTPMLHFDSGHQPGGVASIALEPAFFASAESRAKLVEHIAVPLIEARQPQQVAWTFTGTIGELESDASEEVLAAVVVDRERHEAWHAQMLRRDDAPPAIGGWRQLPANQQAGFLVTPIQNALR